VSLCKQQRNVIDAALPVSVGLISGADEPNQWKDANLWRTVLSTHRIMVTTPQVLLDALRHAYVDLGRDISLLIFDEAHHAVDNNPYNQIMKEFYFRIPEEPVGALDPSNPQSVRPKILGLTASPVYGGNVEAAFR
jgi:endoribonuclease Dicer